MKKPIISLVIPCYNEARNLERLVTRCEEVFEEIGIEVILVDNGSVDSTPEIMSSLLVGSQVCRSTRIEVNQGYGYGILSGLKICQGDFLGWTHADLQTDPADVLAALKIILSNEGKGYFIKGERHNRPLKDAVFAWGMALFEFLVLGVKMWDINAQPNIFPRSFFESWDKTPHDFSLDLFAYTSAVKRGIEIKRIPVYFPARKAGIGSNDTLKKKIVFTIRTLKFSLTMRKLFREAQKKSHA